MTAQESLSVTCPACTAKTIAPVLSFETPVPVLCNAFLASEEQARMAPSGFIDLVICRRCTLLWNSAFRPALVDYATNYDNALHHSGVFATYSESLATRLSERYGQAAGRIVEIGCGDGSFLDRVCELSGSVGEGFDPSFAQKSRGAFTSPRVSIQSRLFAPGDADGATLIIARHVLEHVADPAQFLRMLRDGSVASSSVSVYVEVPSADYMLRKHSFWDLIYEHPTYFTRHSLERLMLDAGWLVLDSGESFHGQYLWVEARTSTAVQAPPESVDGREDTIRAARQFGSAFSDSLRTVDGLVRERSSLGPVVLWGAGSKGVTLLNLLPSRQLVAWAVDINPAKQGGHVPGSGHRVVAPAELKLNRSGTILVMNEAYIDEVREMVDQMGLEANVQSCVAPAFV
jgi:hypothetical protein